MAAGCAKCIVVVVNIIFTLIGLAFIIAGGFLIGGRKYYEEELDKLQDEIPDIASGAGLTVEDEDDSSGSLDLVSILRTMGIVLLVFGLFIFITGFLGMCGACCTKKWMLVVYIIIVAIVIIAQLGIIIALASGRFEDEIKDEMKDIIQKDYGGIDDFSAKSLSMTYVMLDYECCGVDGYEDFNDTESWQNNRTLNLYGFEASYILETPIACCKTSGSFPRLSIDNINCTIAPTEMNSNFEKGCWDEVKDEVEEYQLPFIISLSVLLVFEIFCIILAACILKNGDRATDDYA